MNDQKKPTSEQKLNCAINIMEIRLAREEDYLKFLNKTGDRANILAIEYQIRDTKLILEVLKEYKSITEAY